MNEWTSVSATTDRRRRAIELARAHERMSAGNPVVPGAVGRSVIERSWARSAAAGVDPGEARAPELLRADEVEQRWRTHALSIAMPMFRQMLAGIGDDEHVVALSDADGALLRVEGRPALVDWARSAGVEPGSAWSEEAVGTNALGTALAERHAVQVFSAEHFAAPVHGFACAGAPIFDPLSGDVLGAVAVAGGFATAHPHTLALVSQAGRLVEQELLRRAHEVVERTLRRPAATLCVLGRDRGLLRTQGRAIELSRRHTEMLLLLWLRPEGLSAEQLALELYGERGRPGSVRTEMHRLRAQLVGLIGERPYRLLSRVACDAAAVEQGVLGGGVEAALDGYRGPALPGTQVPRLVEFRDRIDDGLRAAVLATGDVQLLDGWLRTASGEDDLEASRALIARLDRADPRRASERARLRRLVMQERG